MGICESSKNQNTTSVQNARITNTSQTPSSQQIPQNTVSKVEQNNNSNINNNTNLLNGSTQNKINKQVTQYTEENDDVSGMARKASMGSSINNDDSIGFIQTRNTLA